MANIQNELNNIKTALYGKDVRNSIHDAIKTCYDDASVNNDNANMEVKLARGTHNTLNDRLCEVDEKQNSLSSQLEHNANYFENKKMDKNGIVSMANMGQDVKEAMTGGSVAVVGINSVDIINLSGTILEQIGEKISLSLTWEQNTHYRGDVGSTAQANTVSELYHSSIIEVKEGNIYTVNLKTQSENQTGLMFVDDDMTIIKKELVGTGTTLEFSNYYFQIPVNATKLILCTYSVFGNISNAELNKIFIFILNKKIKYFENFAM